MRCCGRPLLVHNKLAQFAPVCIGMLDFPAVPICPEGDVCCAHKACSLLPPSPLAQLLRRGLQRIHPHGHSARAVQVSRWCTLLVHMHTAGARALLVSSPRGWECRNTNQPGRLPPSRASPAQLGYPFAQPLLLPFIHLQRHAFLTRPHSYRSPYRCGYLFNQSAQPLLLPLPTCTAAPTATAT